MSAPGFSLKRPLLCLPLLLVPMAAAWINAEAFRARRLSAQALAETNAALAREAAASPWADPLALYRSARALGGETVRPSAEASALMDRALPLIGHKPVAARWRLFLADRPGEGMRAAARLAAEISRSPKAWPGRALYSAGAALNEAGEEQEAFELFLRGLAFDAGFGGRSALALARYANADGLEAMRWHFLARSLHLGGDPKLLLALADAWAKESPEAARLAEAFKDEARRSGPGAKP
jgi:hypothetical protein